LNLGTASQPYYHGGGWLPSGITPATRVLTPGTYAPKGTWGLRPLTFGEFWGCKDVPESMIRAFDAVPSPVPDDILGFMVAGKCLVAGFKMLNGGGKTFVEMRRNKRASKDIGTDDIGSKYESTKRLKSNVTCGLAVADVGMCKSVGGHTQNVGGHTQNVYEENDICSQKASELIQIPGDREKVSDERRKIRQKASEFIEIPEHRQKVSDATSTCQQKGSDYSDEIRICRETASQLIGSSIPEGFNLIKPVLGTARRLLQKPLQNTTGKELGNEVWEHSSKNENDGRNYACNTDDCILIENLGPDDTCGTIRRNQISHDDNPSIQKNENQSYTLQKTHDAENNQINHEENNPSIRDYEKCGTRRRDPLIYDGTENNKSTHEENNPSICDDNFLEAPTPGIV
jgi:hypothetical protein